MQILITGGGGFLGSHLTERYLNDGHKVIAVDNFCTGMRSNQKYLEGTKNSKNLSFIEANVIEPWDSWASEIDGDIDLVFHFASPASPPSYQRLAIETMWVNTKGLEQAMRFADARNGRVIFASTSEIYGDPEVNPQSEEYWGNVNTWGPRSCYDEAKRFGESLIYTHNMVYGTCHGLVRIFNTYGPRMNPSDGRVIINFLVQGLGAEDLSVYGDGKQTRSFCYVDDLIQGIVKYSECQISEPVNLGNDKEFTILEAAEIVQKLFVNRNLKIKFEDLPIDDPKQRRPNLKKAKELLAPWSPSVSLAEGLEKMLTDLKSGNYL